MTQKPKKRFFTKAEPIKEILIEKEVIKSPNTIFFWLPRIISIGFILFLSIFSFDVFSEYEGLAVLLPLFMHLLPSIVLLVVVILSWKYDLVGAIIFLAFSIFYVAMVGFDKHWSWYAAISIPSLMIGFLYIFSWYTKKGIQLNSTFSADIRNSRNRT